MAVQRTLPRPAEQAYECRPMAAGHVVWVGIVCLTLASLLNISSLEEAASGLPYGAGRTVAVNLVKPLSLVSSALLLDRPRQVVDAWLGREGPSEEERLGAPAPPPPALSPPTSSSTTLPTATPKDPMELWVIGDSFVELFGRALVSASEETGVVSASMDFRFISGLSRPDYFDWPAYLRSELPEVRPDAVVAMFGGNDGQNLQAPDGEILEAWTPPWREEYARRVGEVMDILARGSRRVYWVGLPVMRSEEFSEHVQVLNELYRQEASERSRVTYIDSWSVFAGPEGSYSAYLPDQSGNMRLVRTEDGAHFNFAGAALLAAEVMQELEQDWDLNRTG
ncbi:MAG: DUF459 domain-containing protein [Actinomycetota bacterium]|nr:DUF459 domain-containing protein [Actinomycetota bacterium]